MNSDIVTLKLEEAVKLIPKSTGEDDVYQFIQACDLAIESVEKKNVPILIKYITTKLSAIKYKDTTKWKNIKKYLTDTFEAQHSASALQIELNSIKMLQGENVNTYTNRVEKLFYKLSDMSTANKDKKRLALFTIQ
jgi:TPP-dependent pyruvate/acetoin dehydrogenase alpha subunit